MIDIHCHLLPNIGDGPKDPDDSANMLRQAAGDGITHLVAVCHYEKNVERRMAREVALLQPLARELGMTLTAAIEYNFADLELIKDFVTVDESGKYFLLDFCSSSLPYTTRQQLTTLRRRGLTAIAVHPEKLFNGRTLRELYDLQDLGLLIALNASSLMPSSRYRDTAREILLSGHARIIASDAHSIKPGPRPSEMAGCAHFLSRHYGRTFANILMKVNPERVAAGEVAIPPNQWLQLSIVEKIRKIFRF